MTIDESPLPVHFDYSEPNPVIFIYKGFFELTVGDFAARVEGEIRYQWLPNPAIVFDGLGYTIDLLESKRLFETNEPVNINVPGFSATKCFLTNLSVSNATGQMALNGQILTPMIAGDYQKKVEHICFQVPNLPSFRGRSITTTVGKEFRGWKGRVIFQCVDYTIVLDQAYRLSDIHRQLKQAGGFQLHYAGVLKTAHGTITYEDSLDILHTLGIFLSFLSGGQTNPHFLVGVVANEQQWVEYSTNHVAPYRSIQPWSVDGSTEGIEAMWPNFYRFASQNEDLYVLSFVIHWYCQAQHGAGFAEGSIVLLQNALELLYNWWLIEKQGVPGRAKVSAAKKTTALLNFFAIPTSIPIQYIELRSLLNENGPGKGPEAVTSVRNAIVHGEKKKRIKLQQIPALARHQALQLYLFYVEILLLKIFDFKGVYFNRMLKRKAVFGGKTGIDLD